jgi:hypothetical protein
MMGLAAMAVLRSLPASKAINLESLAWPTCTKCDHLMRLVGTEPDLRHSHIHIHTYACVCGELAVIDVPYN